MLRVLPIVVLAAVFCACTTPAPDPSPTYAPQPVPSPAAQEPPPPASTPSTDSDAHVPVAEHHPDVEEEGTPVICGSSGEVCPADHFCQTQLSDSCNLKGAGAHCQLRPEICNRMYAPVCGCDGKTYSNSCSAAAQGANIRSKRECASKAQSASCGGIMGKRCAAGLSCVDDPKDSCDPKKGGRDCMGMCVSP